MGARSGGICVSERDQPLWDRRSGAALPQCQPKYHTPHDEPLAGTGQTGDAGQGQGPPWLLEGVFAPVLNVDQGVVQRRSVVAGEAVALARGGPMH